MATTSRTGNRKKMKRNLSDPIVQKRFKRAMKKWERKTKPLIDATRRASQISERDLSIIINL